MSQYVVLSVSSDVITFHRRVTARKRKREKTEGKGRATRYGKAERNRSRERDEEGKRKPILCRVESELLLSLLPCISHKTGDRKEKDL